MKRWGVGGVKQRHLWTSWGPASELFFASTEARHRPSIESFDEHGRSVQIKNKMSKRARRIFLRNCRDFGMAIWG